MSIRPLLALVLAFCLTVVTACSGGADAVERSNITYDDIRNTGIANVVVGDVGTFHRIGTTAAGGHHGETESQHQGQQGTDAHGIKPNGRTETGSTDQADPTGVKQPFRNGCLTPVGSA